MILLAEQIRKAFGPTIALADGRVTLRSGEIHALVGENGAGKSTLLKVIAGHERRDAGHVTLDGVPFEPATPTAAAQAGVAMVLQELTVSRSLGVAENVYVDRLRSFTTRWGTIDRERLARSAQAVLDELGTSLSVKDRLSSLELGQLKILEIARALSYRPRVLLLDESTAFLNTREIDELLRVMRLLKGRGLVVGFVSHHLDEVQEVADRVTILKDGSFVGEFAVSAVDRKQIERLMVGREATFSFSESTPRRDELALEVRGARFTGMPEDVSLTFSLRSGEVLGIGGLQGAGGRAVLEGLAGERGLAAGAMSLLGRPYAPASAHAALACGVAYLPGDRTSEGLIPEFSVLENVVMPRYPRIGPFFARRRAEERTRAAMAEYRIKAEHPDTRCSSLSGGNMQKTLLAKSLHAGPRILLLDNPTRGVDVASRFDIYANLNGLVRSGLSVVLLTEDLIELLGLAHRILVLKKGHIRGEFSREDAPTESDVIAHMV